MERNLSPKLKFLLQVGLLLLILCACLYIYQGNRGLRCLFYELTGLYCPGCGSGRAMSALLHGELRSAFRNNLLFLPLGVPAALAFFHEFLRVLHPKLGWSPIVVPQWAVYLLCAIVFLFWFLRNIPAFSFLAPV